MSRPRHTNGPPIQLFPFLDVFICTMGCLIVMLMVVSQKVREKTIAKVAAEQTAVGELLEDEQPAIASTREPEPVTAPTEPEPTPQRRSITAEDLAAAQQRILDLEQQAVALDRTLRDRKAAIATLHDETQTTTSKVALAASTQSQLKERLRAAEQAQVVDQEALRRLRTEQQRLRDKIYESRKLLAEHKQNDGNSSHIIVPYDGVTGTTRRPIVLECTDDGIKFVSENIKLTANDLQHFGPANNPVLAGARELVRYWASRNAVQDNPETQPKPYVLLVVRPSGTLGYYVARGFLEELGTEFGYELVSEDFRFEAPATEARATELCQAAIDEALRQRGASGRPTESFSKALDSELKARALSGTANSHAGESGVGRSGSSGGTFTGITDSGRRPEKFSAQTLSRGGGTASQRFFSSGDFMQHREEVESGGSAPRGSASGAIASGSSGGAYENSASGSRAGNGLRGGTSGGVASNSSNSLSNNRDTQVYGRPSKNGSSSQFEFSDDQAPLVEPPAGGSAGSGSKASTAASRSVAQADRNSGVESLEPHTPNNAATSGKSSKFPTLDGDGAGNGTANSGAESQSGGSSSRGSASLGSNKSGPSIEMSSPGENLLSKRDLKELKDFKRQWGIPNPKGTIALEKEMVIVINGDRVIVHNRYRISRTEDRTNAEVAELTIEAMDVIARDWGRPPEQFYWLPNVELVVQRGGEIWKESFKRALEQSGVTVKVSYE